MLAELREILGVSDLTMEQFPGGYSNLTYLLESGDRAWVLRCPPKGVRIKTAHDMGREARVLLAVHDQFPLAPKVVHVGENFFIMERIEGVIIRKDLASPLDMAALSASFVDTLARLHAVQVPSLGHPEGYVQRQVTGWGERFHKAKTDDVPDCASVVGWLATHLPPEQTPTLIHNDYKYDNLVLRGTEIVGVLDWEMATVGDPLMDLGCSLGYWVQANDPPVLQAMRLCATNAPGNFTRRQLADRYAQKTGRSLEHLSFYYAFGLFKIAVIAQQLYRRFKDGKSNDQRLVALGMAVAGLLQMAEHVATTAQLDFA